MAKSMKVLFLFFILLLLLVFSFPNLYHDWNGGKVVKTVAIIKKYNDAIKRYREANGHLPDNLRVLLQEAYIVFDLKDNDSDHLSDVWGNKLLYMKISCKDGEVFYLSSPGRNGKYSFEFPDPCTSVDMNKSTCWDYDADMVIYNDNWIQYCEQTPLIP